MSSTKKRSKKKTPRRSTRSKQRSRKGKEHDQYVLEGMESSSGDKVTESALVGESSANSARSPVEVVQGEDIMIESTPHVFSVNTPSNGKSTQVNLKTLIDVAEAVTDIVGCVSNIR